MHTLRINWNRTEKQWKRTLDTFISPILPFLTHAGIHPWQITVLRLCIGAIGIALVYSGMSIIGAAILLVALCMDSIDGGLARKMGTSSHKGTFLDRACDYTTYALSIITALALSYIGPLMAAYHIYIMFTSVILTMIYKQEGKKTDWIINPTANLVWFMIAWYASFFGWAFLGIHIMEKTLFWLNILLTMVAAQSISGIVNRWYYTSSPKSFTSAGGRH